MDQSPQTMIAYKRIQKILSLCPMTLHLSPTKSLPSIQFWCLHQDNIILENEWIWSVEILWVAKYFRQRVFIFFHDFVDIDHGIHKVKGMKSHNRKKELGFSFF